MKKVEISDKDKINNNDDETTILDFNEELIPNNDESNEISRSSFMHIKSTFNKMKINKANNQIDLEIEKIEKKIQKNKTFIYTYFSYYLFNTNVIRCF